MIRLRTLVILGVAAGLCMLAVFVTSSLASRQPKTGRLHLDTRSQLSAGYAGDSGRPASPLSPLSADIVASAGQDEALLAKTELRIGQSSAAAGATTANPRLEDFDKAHNAATAVAPVATPTSDGLKAPSVGSGPVGIATAVPSSGRSKPLPTPTAPSYVPLTLIPCSLQTLWRSVNSLTETQVLFSNKTSQVLKVYEVNFGGGQDYRGDVDPGKQLLVNTYVTHPWLVTDASGGCYGVYSPRSEPGLVVIN